MILTGVDHHRTGMGNMTEVLPRAHRGQPGYSGVLDPDLVTVATRLRDAGYHTYMAGKWHLGHEPHQRPFRRGFERTITLADTGADNWEQRSYLPIYEKANWYADGEEHTLPDDFYSSKYFVDKTIEFIDANREDGRPFFSYLAFQAVHIPVQAPRAFTQKYLDTYEAGWTVLREARRNRAADLGLIPENAELASMATTDDWQAESEDERRYHARRMAVYAGMVDAMDHHIGRLIAYLEEIGEYDDTVFLFVSDNGAEPAAPLASAAFRLWLRSQGYSLELEGLGERGSYNAIGPSFASAASAPGSYYKMTAGEGGLRVPLIVAGAGVPRSNDHTDAFAFVTDIVPTILDLAGVSVGAADDRGVAIMGTSLRPLLEGGADAVHGADEEIGYELSGNAALFKADYKLLKNRRPIGDGEWHLFDIRRDPGESRDLRESHPAVFEDMVAAHARYVERNGVLPMPEGYDTQKQLGYFGLRKRLGIDLEGRMHWVQLAAFSIVLAMAWGAWRRVRSRRTPAAPSM